MFNFNDAQKEAYQAIISGFNVCITGSGGVGKSYVIQQIRKEIEKETLFVAPTGIAATNIGGATIHKTFGLKPQVFLKKPFVTDKTRQILSDKNIRRIVIDEISMVRIDVFEAMDAVLRECRDSEEPFGGLQIIVMGDFFQLPPIVSSREKDIFYSRYKSIFCFESDVWKRANFLVCDLKESMRQKNKDFVEMLNRFRTGTHTKEDLNHINKTGLSNTSVDDSWIMLSATNAAAGEYNREMYALLDSSEKEKTYKAKIDSGVSIRPVDEYVTLKKGAKVLIKANCQSGLYVNGDRGEVVEVFGSSVLVKLLDGRLVTVVENTWEEKEYISTYRGFKLETIGSFKQIPLKLGWAITIHSSQGLTLDSCILNTGRGCFSDGQFYVAISRIRDLNKFCLVEGIRPDEVMTSKEVKQFYENQDKYSSNLSRLVF